LLLDGSQPRMKSLLQDCLDAVNARHDTLESVYVVDMSTTFNTAKDLRESIRSGHVIDLQYSYRFMDNIHPNNQGSEKMAVGRHWKPCLMRVCSRQGAYRRQVILSTRLHFLSRQVAHLSRQQQAPFLENVSSNIGVTASSSPPDDTMSPTSLPDGSRSSSASAANICLPMVLSALTAYC
jgi:hypothetical protein